MNDVIKMKVPRFGLEALTYAWYRLVLLPGFDGRTAMQLVEDNKTQQILYSFAAVDAGVYA